MSVMWIVQSPSVFDDHTQSIEVEKNIAIQMIIRAIEVVDRWHRKACSLTLIYVKLKDNYKSREQIIQLAVCDYFMQAD